MSRIELLNQMLQEDPGDPFLKYALALEFEKNNEAPKAIDQLRQLKSTNPEYLPLYYKTGKLFEESGDKTNAIVYYREGIELAKQQQETKTLNELREALFLLEEE